ncbi:MAG: hypothetical protein ACFCU7_08790 [Pleurocapsa sp.]
MNKTKNNQNQRVSQWQLNKMMTIIAQRWQEVWDIVEARDKNKN